MKVEEEIKKEAVDLAHKIADVLDVELDFSEESIEQVEIILSKLSEKYQQDSDEGEARTNGFACAAYIADVLDKNHEGGSWEVDDESAGKESYPYKLADGGTAFPFAWCMKRIIDGEGDNVWFKYKTLVQDK